uniref:DUF7305 domain-containing protein n=1 Tax=Natrinema halophilum TaxID=1699371 RepID=A0A7D5KK97_9EURY
MAVILLIGMVVTISAGILLVGADVMTDAEQRSENERIEQSFVELSQQMSTVSMDGDARRSMTFDAGKKGAIVKTNTAYINISGNNVSESIQVGAIEYEGDDGTKVAFQAGGVFRETGSETQVVSAPPLNYDQETNTFSFPILQIDEESSLNSGDVSFRYKNSTPHHDSTYVEQSTVKLNITSEYCTGWETYFEEQTKKAEGQAIYESCSEGDDDTLRVRLGRMTVPEKTFADGIIAGDVSYQGSKPNNSDVTETDGDSPPKLDGMIDQMVSDMENDSNVTRLGSVGDTVPNGTYFAEDVTVDDDLTFDLEDGDTTLVVEDELIVDDGTLHVENWSQSESTDHKLQIYVKEGMHVKSTEMCVAPCSSGNVDSKQLQVYGTSETHLALGTGNTSFEGIIYAPGGEDWNKTNRYITNKEAQLVVQSNVDMVGSTVVSSAHLQSNALSGLYDASLETFSPEVAPEGYLFPPHLTYLNIAEHIVEVKNT